MSTLSRRLFALGLPVALGACAPRLMARRYPLPRFRAAEGYGANEDDGWMVPDVNTARINPAYFRQDIAFYGR
jgi:hypothetical protein